MTRALAILLFVAAIAFALAPLATPGFNGFEPDQFPVPQIDPPAQPAGYAFAIWGVIYVWLIVGTGFQMLKRADDPAWEPVRLPLLLSLLAGAPWLAVAQQSAFWATVWIWVMWAAAVLALLRAPQKDGWFGHWPIGLYAGWLTGASCVSLALMLAGFGVTDEKIAAWVALTLALVVAYRVMHHRPDAPSYPLAVIWALIGVVVANWPDGALSALGLSLAGSVLLAVIAVRNLRATR